VPAVGLACGVLQCEGEDGVALLDRCLALTLIGRKGRVDGIKGLGGRELVWNAMSEIVFPSRVIGNCGNLSLHVPFLRDIVEAGYLERESVVAEKVVTRLLEVSLSMFRDESGGIVIMMRRRET
jgi:hypothetical protein